MDPARRLHSLLWIDGSGCGSASWKRNRILSNRGQLLWRACVPGYDEYVHIDLAKPLGHRGPVRRDHNEDLAGRRVVHLLRRGACRAGDRKLQPKQPDQRSQRLDIAVYQIPGSNAIAVADAVRKRMDGIEGPFSPGYEFVFCPDTTLAVHAGIEEIIHTLLEAVVLVILVVFLFLQNWRATLIPLLTVPVSLIGTFIVFPLLGFSVNTLSLGLVLAIGLVVDDAIVVVEAVIHNIEHGLAPKEATSKARKRSADRL